MAAVPAAEVVTFGCRLNAFESEIMRGHAQAAGLADAVIVNTCAVTGEAERQARQAIRRLRRRRPGAQIIVTGCAAQLDPNAFARMPEVDRVLGNAEKLRPASYAATAAARINVDDIMAVRETAGHLIDGLDGRARAFVQVQNGCDYRCTFCVIPYARGPSRSVPMGAVAGQIRRLAANGCREVVLTGVDITSYGQDLPGTPRLGQMVARVLAAVPELPRLRLSSLDPAAIDETLVRLIGDEPRLMPHLHLSLQAGDDMILKRMARRHRRADAVALVHGILERRPEAVFGADLIAGFPTETEAMFANTLALVDDCALSYLHVFPYSPRAGTPAARMPQLPRAVAKTRAADLRAAGEHATARLLRRLVGTRAQVLIERDGLGRTEHFAPIAVTPAPPPGAIVPVTVTGADRTRLRGRPAARAAA